LRKKKVGEGRNKINGRKMKLTKIENEMKVKRK
jgi:hypothetical protein